MWQSLILFDPSTHGYLLFHGTRAFRQAAASWYTKFGITVDPETGAALSGSRRYSSFTFSGAKSGRFCLLLDPGYHPMLEEFT